jgi:hypothetical protein
VEIYDPPSIARALPALVCPHYDAKSVRIEGSTFVIWNDVRAQLTFEKNGTIPIEMGSGFDFPFVHVFFFPYFPLDSSPFAEECNADAIINCLHYCNNTFVSFRANLTTNKSIAVGVNCVARTIPSFFL